MAVVKQPNTCSLKLRYQKGVNGNGDPVYVNRTYSKVKTAANDQDLHEVAMSISGLQTTPVQGIYRVDDSQLLNQ